MQVSVLRAGKWIRLQHTTCSEPVCNCVPTVSSAPSRNVMLQIVLVTDQMMKGLVLGFLENSVRTVTGSAVGVHH